jgi:putative pre-16S rRNA nuclease
VKRALGIDLGEARIGLAISDELGLLAHPLETLRAKERRLIIEEITEIIDRHSISTVIIGLPRNMNGTYGPAAEKAREFAAELRLRVTCHVRLWDERLTSVAAQRALHESGRTVKQSRELIDQVAAQLILQAWLDSQQGED